MHFTETGESKKGWSLLFRKGMMESLKANANLFVNDNNNNIIIIIIIIKTIIDNGNLAMDIPRGGSSFYCFH